MKAIMIEEQGPPSVMKLVDVKVGKPKAGEIRIRQTAIGLNFIDTYHRSGLYRLPMPSGIGREAAGVVEAIGHGVKGFKVGDRIAYGTAPIGSYAEVRNIPAACAIHIPKSISDETAAAMMLKGMTARYLLRETFKVKRGQTILLHAAAGAVGQIIGQWAKALGVKVIGTVGSADKIMAARASGCAHVIDSSTEDVVARVREITKGAGVPVVYDGIGQATFMTSLDCLMKRGLLVSFGNASGPVRGVDLGILASKGSLYVTRPLLFDYTADEKDLRKTAADLIAIVKSGKVKVPVNQRYALADAAKAHEDLVNRRTIGATVLIP
jgi:NADPH2:quinone reductase